ncbi:MAG: hypothetical protein KJO07_09865, partial [Deltaproteobacteria bacterium]|nr:hypothetical protein [Deltaproteobacteria bacterium]
MANAAELLQSLRDDPMDEQALAGLLESDLDQLRSEESARLLSATRRMLRDRGALEVASKILDLEISASTETDTQVRLLSEQGTMQLDELGADDAAQAYFRRALELDQDNREAKQNLDAVELIRENAPALAEKFKLEADAATDRDLASRLLASAAMMLCRVAPDSDDIDLLLNQALERAPRNRRAEAVLKRRLRVQARWEQLAELLRSREAHAQSADERAALLSDLADALSKAGKEDEAHATWRQVLTVQPGHRRATSILVGELEERDDAEGLVEVYEKALSGRKAGDKDEEVGLLMQLGMLLWTR